MEHVGSKQGRAGPAQHHGLGMHSQAHRAPAMWADDSEGERLTAARSHHMPELWGTPELKNRLRGRLEVAGAAWKGKQHRGTGGQTKEGSRTGQDTRW